MPKIDELTLKTEKSEKIEGDYTLHSVFIHKGSAYYGHYYVYIKSFENNRWYLFDDH